MPLPKSTTLTQYTTRTRAPSSRTSQNLESCFSKSLSTMDVPKYYDGAFCFVKDVDDKFFRSDTKFSNRNPITLHPPCFFFDTFFF